MPQDFDVDKFMAERKKGVEKPAPSTPTFDVDAFMRERKQPTKPKPRNLLPTERQEFNVRRAPSMDESLNRSAQTNRLSPPIRPESQYGPLYESVRDQKRRAFEQKPMLEQWKERGKDALARGGESLANAMTIVPSIPNLFHSRKARETGDKALAQWRERRGRELEERRLSRPEGGLLTQASEGVIEALPMAGIAAATGGGGLVQSALTGAALSASTADWRDPKRAAIQTGIGALAPVAGGAAGGRVGAAVANRLARPAAQAVARGAGEILGGGAGNVIGTGGEQLAFEGKLNPRELAKSAAIGTALSAPGAVKAARRPLSAEAAKLPQSRTPSGAIIAGPSSLPSRKLLPPGSPNEVPTEQLTPRTRPIVIPDAPATQEMPAFKQRLALENAPTAEQPAIAPRRTAELPKTPPAQPVTTELEANVSQRPRVPTERLPVPKATDENIQALRSRQEELGRLAYDRRGDFTGDLRDEYNQINARIRDYENKLAPKEIGPPPGQRPEALPNPAERSARQAALATRPETGAIGRPVTQEMQIPGLKATEVFKSREDARQGHFEQFNDDELVQEIRRMEDVQNQATRGRSKLSPAELEANRFDLKVAVEMQKERGRLQRQIGIEPANRIAPRTPGRPQKRQIQHTEFGLVTEAENQKGVPAGKIRVTGDDGDHVIQNPRTKGNTQAAFVRSIPAEAMEEMTAPGAPKSPSVGQQKPPAKFDYTIPPEAAPELSRRSKGHVMGMGLGPLQGLFEGRAKLPKPGQQEMFPDARKGRKDNENAGLGSMVGGAFRTASQGLRTFKTAFDLSAPLSQGAFLTRAHPLKGARSFGKMMRSLSPSQSATIDKEILNHPLRKLGEESGLHIATGGSREEAFMLGKLNKVPGIAASERTYRTYLDSLRLSVWESYVKSLQSSGYTPDNNPKAYRQAAEFINIATGRGSLKAGGKLASAMALGGDILFAPRNLASKFQVLDPVRYAKLAPGARKLVLQDAVNSFGVIVATAALLREAGVRVGLTPTDDDFMEARWGNHRFDLTAGLKTEVKFLAKMIAGSYNKANGERNLPGQDPLDVAKNYARGKLAPGPGFAYDALKGSDFRGRKLSEKSATDLAFEFGPMILEDLKEGYEDSGVQGALKSSPSFIGQRVSVRPDRAKASWLTTSREVGDELRKLEIPRPYLGPKRARKSGEKDEAFDEFNARRDRFDQAWSRMSQEMIQDSFYKDADKETKTAAWNGLKRHLAGLGKDDFEEKGIEEIIESAMETVEKRRDKEQQ